MEEQKPIPEVIRVQPNDLAALTFPSDSPILACLMRLEGKPVNEVIPTIFEELISLMAIKGSDDEKIFKGFFSSLPHMNFDGPEWVKGASKKMFESMGMDCLANFAPGADILSVIATVGTIIGIAEHPAIKPDPASPDAKYDEKILIPVTKGMRQLAGNEEPKKAAIFFNARNEAEKVVEKMNQPTLRALIYETLVRNWVQVERLKSTGQLKSTSDLHQLLLGLKYQSGKLIFPPNVDSREIRKACENIGLKFENQWQKPKTEKI